jgi:hypothetical protein
LAFVSERLLSSEEVDAVRVRSRRLRLRALAVMALELAVIAAIVITPAIIPEGWVDSGSFEAALFFALVVLFLLAILLGLPLAILTMRDTYWHGRMLKRALGDGVVSRFEGQINWHDWTDPAVARLVKAKALSHGEEAPCTLELFSRLSYVYAFNGAPVSRLIPLEPVRAAERPERPIELAVPASWYDQAPPEALERRRQSAAETDELVSYARQFRDTPAIVRYLGIHLTVVMLICVFNWSSYPTVGMRGVIPSAVIVVLYLTHMARQLLRERRLSMLYWADAQLGWVLIAPSDEVDESGSGLTEFLPVSGLVWTIAGRPAGWRNRCLK